MATQSNLSQDGKGANGGGWGTKGANEVCGRIGRLSEVCGGIEKLGEGRVHREVCVCGRGGGALSPTPQD